MVQNLYVPITLFLRILVSFRQTPADHTPSVFVRFSVHKLQ